MTGLDRLGPTWPVSVKGVILDHDRVVVLRNERDEWELPGGRLEPGETIEECLVREVREELGIVVSVGPLLDVWLYELPEATILIVTYGCTADTTADIRHSSEHSEHAWLDLVSLRDKPLPAGYVRAVERWWPRSMFADVPESLSEELLAERRAEAARDAEE